MIEPKELAAKTGKTARYMSYIFSGNRTPSRKLAEKLESLTGIPCLCWLYPDKYPNPYIKKKASNDFPPLAGQP